jgi:DeoR family fructose operon transcriptional repressor
MTGKVKKRQEALMSAVQSGLRDAKALSQHLGVSLITIRRDLKELSAQGRLLRTLGGAASTGGHEQELNLTQRKQRFKARKEAIARAAVAQIHPGETIILDSGTTTAALAQLLCGRQNLRVITNSMQVWLTLAHEPGIELIVLGGQVRAVSWATVGPLSNQVMRKLSADRVFLGADGIVAGRGICEASHEQIELKELMMAQSDHVHVLVDSSKLGRAAQQAWAPLERPWTLFTDADASSDQLEPFRRLAGVTIEVAS